MTLRISLGEHQLKDHETKNVRLPYSEWIRGKTNEDSGFGFGEILVHQHDDLRPEIYIKYPQGAKKPKVEFVQIDGKGNAVSQ